MKLADLVCYDYIKYLNSDIKLEEDSKRIRINSAKELQNIASFWDKTADSSLLWMFAIQITIHRLFAFNYLFQDCGDMYNFSLTIGWFSIGITVK